MLTLILTILLFCIMIIPHEFGHFITAKLVGVQVNEFSVGMGPALYQKQRGETLYSVRAVPIGGYCAMEGEDEESSNPRAFNNKKAWQKILVLIAGAAMNILCAVVLMIIAVMLSGVPTTTIGTVTEDSPAYISGIRTGDEIVAVNGESTDQWSEFVTQIGAADAEDVIHITVERDGSEETYDVTPVYDEESQRYMIGVSSQLTHGVLTGVKYGTIATWNLNKLMLGSVRELFTGGIGKDDVSGPVGMVSLVNQTAHASAVSYIYLTALICLNLAVINLLPLPALDGGRIVFVVIRKITGKRITDTMEGGVHAIGMMLLIALFIFVTWNDITRLIG